MSGSRPGKTIAPIPNGSSANAEARSNGERLFAMVPLSELRSSC